MGGGELGARDVGDEAEGGGVEGGREVVVHLDLLGGGPLTDGHGLVHLRVENFFFPFLFPFPVRLSRGDVEERVPERREENTLHHLVRLERKIFFFG